jgi:hypothetical protein
MAFLGISYKYHRIGDYIELRNSLIIYTLNNNLGVLQSSDLKVTVLTFDTRSCIFLC